MSGRGRVKTERPSLCISQAAQRILAEAARTLGKEPAPRRRVGASTMHNAPLPDFAEGLGKTEREQLVEIIDAADRPLAVMAPKDALRQGLRFRRVAVVLRTPSDTVLLLRRKDERAERFAPWDIGTGFVRVGEAREDAAVRLLAEKAGLSGIRPRLVTVAANEVGFAYDLTLYVAELPKGLLPWREEFEGCAMDRDELEGVLKEAPELFSEELRWAAATGRLFER